MAELRTVLLVLKSKSTVSIRRDLAGPRVRPGGWGRGRTWAPWRERPGREPWLGV